VPLTGLSCASCPGAATAAHRRDRPGRRPRRIRGNSRRNRHAKGGSRLVDPRVGGRPTPYARSHRGRANGRSAKRVFPSRQSTLPSPPIRSPRATEIPAEPKKAQRMPARAVLRRVVRFLLQPFFRIRQFRDHARSVIHFSKNLANAARINGNRSRFLIRIHKLSARPVPISVKHNSS
jgi:hypothetical protein